MASTFTQVESNSVAPGQTRSLRGKVSPEEWDTRVQLAAAYRLTEMMGWQSTIIYNHISARVPGEDHHILLNPLGLRYDEVTASNLVKIDLDGNVVDGSPYPINQAGYTIHSAIHAARPDVVCAFHTHTEDGTAVSSLEEGLMFTNQEVLMFHGTVGWTWTSANGWSPTWRTTWC
jgi:ribulose-5-phosphate 4-epimerase/fuculose-1-phosphate aldolase